MITPYITDAGYGNLQAKIVSCRARAGVFLVADPALADLRLGGCDYWIHSLHLLRRPRD